MPPPIRRNASLDLLFQSLENAEPMQVQGPGLIELVGEVQLQPQIVQLGLHIRSPRSRGKCPGESRYDPHAGNI